MKANFENCLEIILEHEGGFVNHPKDPGGATNMGITKNTWERFIGKDVTIEDMKNLTFDQVKPVYEYQYWDRIKGDELPLGLDLCVFDWGVNSGTGRASKALQELIGATPDGAIGPNTLRKLSDYIDWYGIESVIVQYSDIRQEFYESLGTFDTFGRGWTRRNTETRDIALEMCN